LAVKSIIESGSAQVLLTPTPIRPKWVIEGNPIARSKLLSVSDDGSARSYIWDCTAGRFNWYYDADETVFVIEGGVVIKDAGGATRRIDAGDTIFFPAGVSAEWHVKDYIRKFAVVRTPLPRALIYARRGFRFLKRCVNGGGSKNAVPATFPSGC
jgi:uncharacterized protein